MLSTWAQSVNIRHTRLTQDSYVLLHGLNGDPKTTWEHSNGFYWPAQIAKDISGSRVMVYGYNADFARALVENETTIDAIAEDLLSQLVVKRQGELVCFQIAIS